MGFTIYDRLEASDMAAPQLEALFGKLDTQLKNHQTKRALKTVDEGAPVDAHLWPLCDKLPLHSSVSS